jgi:hypothetical protein
MPSAPIATPGSSGEPHRSTPTPTPTAAVPYVHGRHLVPIRVVPRRVPDLRSEGLLAEEDRVRARIDEIDAALVDLAAQRRGLLQRIRDLHNELRPPITNSCGRRRRQVSHEEALSSIEGEPTWLSGRELRAICLAFLRRTRVATTLRQLHVLLHRAGFGIASAYPVKTLADALGHETNAGRVARTRRGTYRLLDAGTAPEIALPDW